MRLLSATFFIVLFAFGVQGAESGLIKYEIETDSCVFRCSIVDKIYNNSDTLRLFYSIENNRDNSITIFDPSQYYWKGKPFHRDIHLGGKWLIKLGFKNEPYIITLDTDSAFQYTIELLPQTTEMNSKIDSALFDQRNAFKSDVFYDIVYLDIAYYIGVDEIAVKEVDSLNHVTFRSEAQAFEFEMNCKRIILGPITLRFSVDLLNKK
ncbi:MAG: hypothetical protein GWN01_14705 [Nitrosopumilaceae archaeon]|nr:hypothetical protein [Nitrosopumilaceae archaeon]NIX62704.1 hypothetical protein [Nitrosopumilaceae archaeon]